MLLLIIVLVARAIEVNRPYLSGGANRERHRADKNRKPFLHVGGTSSVVAAVSGLTILGKGGGTPAATAEGSRPRKLSGLVTQEPAERERESSAAKSAQRMSARLAALCRETGAPAPSASTQWQARAHHRNHRSRTSSCRREPSPLLEPKQPRAKFCSTALQSRAFPVSRVWNETGTGVRPCRSLPARRKHNDLKSQTTSRSQPRRLHHARRISYLPQSRMRRDCSRLFFRRVENRRDEGGTIFVAR